MSYYAVVRKRSWSKKPIDVSYELPDGVTISSCTVTANYFAVPDHEGSDVSATLLVSTTASVDEGTVSATVQAGTNKARYLCRFQTTFSDGSRDEKVVLVIVDDDQDD